jgi:hypothetical protein
MDHRVKPGGDESSWPGFVPGIHAFAAHARYETLNFTV